MLKLRPPVVNMAPDREYVVFMGNQRVKAALELGWSAIPVVFVSASREQEKAWNIKDNAHSGTDDSGLLKEALWDLRDSGWNMEELGLTPLDLEQRIDWEPVEIESEENKGSAPRQAKPVTCPHCGETFTPGEEITGEDVVE
jgi:ParB-like chromosome segregation protein Spo0J